jgi:hypothetical protein
MQDASSFTPEDRSEELNKIVAKATENARAKKRSAPTSEGTESNLSRFSQRRTRRRRRRVCGPA